MAETAELSDAEFFLAQISEAAARGLRVSSLCQVEGPSGSWYWQANVTNGQLVWEYGRAQAPGEALRIALLAASLGPGTPLYATRHLVHGQDFQADLAGGRAGVATDVSAEELGL